MEAVAARAGLRVGGLWLPRQSVVGAAVLVAALAFAQMLTGTERGLGPLWLLGLAAGFTLQRSRFCFASAFRDLFLFGQSRIMRGILMGLGVATVGFAIVMANEVPFPAFGALPAQANILPVGASTVVGGVLFGFGMVLSGGCTSGSLYRMGEGYTASAVAVLGMVLGLGLLAHQWNWWFDTIISREPKVWTPAHLGLGYGGAVAVTLGALFVAFLLLLWWESRNGLAIPASPRAQPTGETFSQRLRALWRAVFVDGWSPVVGGAVLGAVGLFMYMVHMPWGVTGELSRWANESMTALSIGAPALRGLSDIGGCAARAGEGGLFTHTFAVTVALLPGALIGALFAGEFKLRFPPKRRRYVQALGGGLAMGYGSGLAIGCTIGAFFSSIPSLSISGWLFAAALGGGAWLGVQAIRRIP